jgi:hypothetical protein
MPRSKSACCHWASKISRRRAPVRIKSRIAAIAKAYGFAFAERIAKPGKLFARKKPLAAMLAIAPDTFSRIVVPFRQEQYCAPHEKHFEIVARERFAAKGVSAWLKRPQGGSGWR